MVLSYNSFLTKVMQIPKIPVPKLPTDMDTKFYGNQLFNTTIFKIYLLFLFKYAKIKLENLIVLVEGVVSVIAHSITAKEKYRENFY